MKWTWIEEKLSKGFHFHKDNGQLINDNTSEY